MPPIPVEKIPCNEDPLTPTEIDFKNKLPKTELNHLRYLDQGHTRYTGRSPLQAELRSLVKQGLIEKLPNRAIGQIKNNMKFNLDDYVKLTEWGERILKGK